MQENCSEKQHQHAYFYQVQLHKVGYCDFVVWNNNELVELKITLDEDFILKLSKSYYLSLVFYQN